MATARQSRVGRNRGRASGVDEILALLTSRGNKLLACFVLAATNILPT